MPNHFLNLIAIYIAIITKRGFLPEKSIYSFGYPSKKVGTKPGFHGYIICRSTMSEGEFIEYLKQNYEYWFQRFRVFRLLQKTRTRRTNLTNAKNVCKS
jgi:hypothetical protein